jgi:hypothetical protein
MDHLHRKASEPAKTSSDRAFGWVFAAFFGLIGGWPLLNGGAPHAWAWFVAAAFAATAQLRPGLLAPLNRLWSRFGLLLHRIVNPVVLGLIFVVAILPIGLLLRALGKDPLRLKRHANQTTYWLKRTPPRAGCG